MRSGLSGGEPLCLLKHNQRLTCFSGPKEEKVMALSHCVISGALLPWYRSRYNTGKEAQGNSLEKIGFWLLICLWICVLNTFGRGNITDLLRWFIWSLLTEMATTLGKNPLFIQSNCNQIIHGYGLQYRTLSLSQDSQKFYSGRSLSCNLPFRDHMTIFFFFWSWSFSCFMIGNTEIFFLFLHCKRYNELSSKKNQHYFDSKFLLGWTLELSQIRPKRKSLMTDRRSEAGNTSNNLNLKSICSMISKW